MRKAPVHSLFHLSKFHDSPPERRHRHKNPSAVNLDFVHVLFTSMKRPFAVMEGPSLILLSAAKLLGRCAHIYSLHAEKTWIFHRANHTLKLTHPLRRLEPAHAPRLCPAYDPPS